MVILTDRENAICNAFLLHSFSELRHEVFVNRLKWPLQCPPGREIDRFDDQDAVYMTISGVGGRVVAGLRLLDTVKRSLLNEVFPMLVDGPLPRDPKVMDVTRFAVDHRPEYVEGTGNLCGLLLCALQDYGLARGLTGYVSVSDVRMEPILRRGGYRFRRMGGMIEMDGTGVVALEVEISPEVRAIARRRAGVSERVLVDERLRSAA
ncbi:autoinducer synthesis protein [Rhodospirillum rubrum F11]|uniref:Acyl-homoserine-lactone synthase n=1 Tax=Rhodospirillum rubrum (strain ATCC 11170 / ATH 1.1.1 / DSM 467 / LMG 4362 / NCIMB 8255 / S1) TaxID=269796 RepID=Q2RNV5_RHORT|nr:acyl-homoserine-lactone synthase [Rhodospirillum rubrum]ABC24190.1 Autoinducer synthesis protein [Rhodospirillum rubrum ATCC 11170]AEO49941.1 autoinducer synthesis protein [Rhodospirillum rubrum F11]MBK5955908.1 autoinducer synthase [Rhodospirillum rubrum]QXG80127.1 autoinducer synthase [Rhodospirillum rubrum]